MVRSNDTSEPMVSVERAGASLVPGTISVAVMTLARSGFAVRTSAVASRALVTKFGPPSVAE